MAVPSDEHRLLYKVAKAYYEDEKTQQQIAEAFGFSRPTVSRMLKRAREQGVVDITVIPPREGATDLERALESAWGLAEAVVVPVDDPVDQESVVRELGPAAAECLVRRLPQDAVLGITWGRTMSALVDALPSQTRPDVTIVQINGGLGPVGALEHSTELGRRMAGKLGTTLKLLPVPGVVSTREAADALRGEKQIADALSLAAEADIVLVGLGVPTSDSVLVRDGTIITQRDLTNLREAGAVGDIALRYIDEEGEPVGSEIDERIIGLSLEQIVEIPQTIGVAGGEEKVDVIRAALRGGLLDVLVTDDFTARSLG